MSDLTPYQKRSLAYLYRILRKNATADGWIHLSQHQLAKQTKWSRPTVGVYLRILQKQGKVEQNNGYLRLLDFGGGDDK